MGDIVIDVTDETSREQGLQRLAVMLASADLLEAGRIALLCGTLVEQGADPQTALPAILTQLVDALETVGGLPPSAQATDDAPAWVAVEHLCLAAIAMLSRSTPLRQAVSSDAALLIRVRESSAIRGGGPLSYLHDLLQTLDEEELLVLHPGLWRGYRVQMQGIGDNFQLHTLLAAALIGDPDEGWLPGKRPDPRLVAAAKDQPVDPATDAAEGIFNLVNWTGLQPDGTVATDHQHWIWGEGIPADIRLFEDRRVVLLEPPPYARAWNPGRKFDGMPADLEVVEILSPKLVKRWLERIASANAGHSVRIEPQPAKYHLNWGQARRQRGDYDGAIADLSKAIRFDPHNAAGYRQRGHAHSGRGDLDRAIADYSEAIRLDPYDAGVYNERGNARSRKGDPDRAIADYSEAIRLDPQDAGTYRNRGIARGRRGDSQAALADFDQAIRLDPQSADAYSDRGTEYHKRGDYQQALADYTRAIQLNPAFALAYSNRASVRCELHDYEGAIDDCHEAIRLDPGYAPAYNNRGYAHLKRGEYDLAIADCDVAIRLRPHAFFYNNRGQARGAKGDYKAAVVDLQEALRLMPNHPEAEDIRAKITRWGGKAP